MSPAVSWQAIHTGTTKSMTYVAVSSNLHRVTEWGRLDPTKESC